MKKMSYFKKRTLIATLLACGLALTLPLPEIYANTPVSAAESEPDGTKTYVYGDVDLSGKLEAVDALGILKHVVQLDTFEDALVLELADTDHNGSVTAADALAVLKCVVGLQDPDYYTVTPEETENPNVSDEPTDNPVKSDEPKTTDEPVVTNKPTDTNEPAASNEPVVSDNPTDEPVISDEPDGTDNPTETTAPIVTESAEPLETDEPKESAAPTETTVPAQSDEPTEPTETVAPTVEPTVKPTVTPTVAPTVKPTEQPTTTPTTEPTAAPVTDTPTPTVAPTVKPTVKPTTQPTVEPTVKPTTTPTIAPTAKPTVTPTTETPTVEPTTKPTTTPTVEPTVKPTATPTATPATETPEPHTHSYVSTVVKPATCTEDGVMTLTCECGYSITKPIPATGHTSVTDAAIAPTCTNAGLTEGSHCSVCGTVLTAQETIPATGHSYGEWEEVKSPTCTDKGSRKQSCTVCGYTKTEDIDATGHEWEDDYTVDKEATCTSEGSKSIHCSRCEAVKNSTIIPMLDHTPVTDAAKAATCTETGLTEGSHCSVCGTILTAQEVIPATGHSYEKTGEQERIVDEEAYDEEVITQTPVWVCYGCDPETYYYSPEEVNAHRKETEHSSIYLNLKSYTLSCNQLSEGDGKWGYTASGYTTRTIEPITTTETVHHDEVWHLEDVYRCRICGDVKEYEKPDPETCEHTYKRTEKRVWCVDTPEHDEVIKSSVDVCICGTQFLSAERLSSHMFANNHGRSYVGALYCNVHYEETGHYETEVTYTCSICGNVKDYVDPETCPHDWYVAREAWDEYVEECHLFCECGYDCGLYDKSHKISADENAEAYANLKSHQALYDTDTMLADHSSATYDTITVTYSHNGTYRCVLCGEYEISE